MSITDADRVDRIAAKIADLDQYAPALWEDAPSYALAPPLDEHALAAREAALGARLPDGYRAFLARVGIAGPGPDYGLAGPDAWAMPTGMPQVVSRVTTKDGATFSAGTGPRAPQLRAPEVARPFPLAGEWCPIDKGILVPPPIGPDAHLYDGTIQLGEIGCGYFYFLVVTGPSAGTVWVDYTAGDGSIAPLAAFLDWYEAWLDGCVTNLLGGAVRDALAAGAPSEHDAHVRRWVTSFTALAERPMAPYADRANLAAVRLYLGEQDAARALIARLDREAEPDEPSINALEGWLWREASAAATADPPDVEVARAAASWRVRRQLAVNPALPPVVRGELAVDERHEVRRAAIRGRACPPEALAACADAALARWTTRGDRAPAYELDLVARHPATPVATLELLSALTFRLRDEPLATAVVRGVAMNAACPPPLLERLADASAPWVRHAVASHPAAERELVAQLARDPSAPVRAAVAARVDADAATLAALATDPASAVRIAVARNPRSPAAVLRRLAAGGLADAELVWDLAANPALPDDALAVLADHPREPIRDGKRPEPQAVATADDPFAAMSTAPTAPVFEVVRGKQYAHPSYPPSLLAGVVADPDHMTGYNAAASPWLDAALLGVLALHPYAYARSRAAEHPAATEAICLRLASDPQPMVVRSAALHVAFDAAMLARLAAEENEELRWAAADNRAAPAELLATLAADPHPYVRRAVAGNPRTPAAVHAALAGDADAGVRGAALMRDDVTDATLAAVAADDVKGQRSVRWQRGRRALATT
jgi:hypothetical protein